MSENRTILLHLSTIEIAQLIALVEQFAVLVTETSAADEAVARLTPDAYPDDPEAGQEFGRLTRDDLLGRRADDAGSMLRALRADGDVPDISELDEASAATPHLIALDPDEAAAWMRTLAALRLVLANRIGIESEDDAPVGDPRFVLYEWLGARLDGLVAALTPPAGD